MTVRYATEEDLHQWYGGPPPFTMRAAVLEVGGRVLAVGGVGPSIDHMQVFCEVAPEARRRGFELGRLAVLVRDMIKFPVFALQNCSEPTAERLLRWCGLTETSPGVWYGSGIANRADRRQHGAERSGAA